MNKPIDLIVDRFENDINLFEAYVSDIKKSIEKLNTDFQDLERKIKEGASIAVPSKQITHEDGKSSIMMGIEDNPQTRVVIVHAIQNKLKDTRKYLDISLIMAFTYLFTIFEAKYMDIMAIYFNSLLSKEDPEISPEQKLAKFGFKSIKKQLSSLKENAKIDMEKLLSKTFIEELEEIHETRNIIAHNSGIVNTKYLSKVKKSIFQIGQPRFIDEAYLERSKETLETFFHALTNKIAEKLN